jgi:polysaccharide chain length determinant protein (PEP-CTERM system associated)
MIGQRELTIDDYKMIVRRRIWLLVIPAVLCAIGAYTVSIFLPSRYTSETVVLVEEQAVPENIVRPVVGGGDVNQRLATMQEQILSRTRLQQVVEKFGLYREETGRRPMEELVARLKKSITVSAVRPMAETRASGLPGFTVSVEASQAYLAQQICSEITSYFMQENVLLRSRRAEDTTQFLTKQLEESKRKLDESDAELAKFQQLHMGSMPDEVATNLSMLSGLSAQLEAATQGLNRAQQDKVFTESMLNQQLAASRPTQMGDNPDTLRKQYVALQERLASLQIRYTDEYPDVVKTKSEIAELQKRMNEEAEANKTQPAGKPTTENAAVDSPQIQQLRAQLHQIEVTVRERLADQIRIQQQINNLQAKLQMSPAVQQEYKSLTRDSQTASNIYNDLLKKQSDSQMGTELELRQQGEQFRVLDAPSLPQQPTFPNRPLFGFGGLMGGLGIGLGIAFILEAQDTTLRTERDVEHLMKLPVLAMIPAVLAAKADGRNGIAKLDLLQKEDPVKPRVGVQ